MISKKPILFVNMIPPRRLVLSGGGVKVISLVGALITLEEAGNLKKVKEVCGVSAGAFLAFILATGYPLNKIKSLILDLDFSVIRNMSPEAFIGFPETFGIDDGTHLVKFLESMIKVALKLDPAMTFEDLQRVGKYTFKCWATDLNTRSAREFSAAKTPSVKIVDALRASMSLPLYFTPMADPITGHLLTDGGIQGNLPLHHLTDDECQDALSLGFCSAKADLKEDAPKDLMGFMNSILTCLTYGRNDTMLYNWSHKIMRIPVDDYPSWNFEASRGDREMLLNTGQKTASIWLRSRSKHSRSILRRHSA
jgi:NTE family protein